MGIFADIRFALRTFVKRPSFPLAAIATLALGIAVNTIVFSLVNALALRPMPVPAASRVVRLYPIDAAGRRPNLFSLPDYADFWQSAVPSLFDTLAAYIPADLTAGRSSLDRSVLEPRATLGYVVSASYFDLTGMRPALGRFFQEADNRAGTRMAVLSHGFWRSRFGADHAVLGATLVLNGEAFTISGVASPEFHGTEPLIADVWIPLSALSTAVPGGEPPPDRRSGSVLVVGRLTQGVSRARATDALSVIARRLAAAYPGPSRPEAIGVASGTFFVLDPGIKPVIAGIMAIVGLVLLVACANVANLILARAASRQREIAVRLAIGANRSRIVRQLIVEALLLSLSAGIVAILLAEWALRFMFALGVSLAPFPWTVALNLEPDIRVFTYTLAIAALGGTLLGLLPALQASSPHIGRMLHDQGAVAGGRLRGSRLRHGLVVVEIAASLVLLMAAGLLARGLQHAQALDLGFATRGVLYAEYDTRTLGYGAARARTFNEALAARAADLPGIERVAFTSHVPLHGGVRRVPVRLVEAPDTPPSSTIVSTVSPGYFAAVGISFVEGRNFARDETAPVVIVSEGLPTRFWPGQPAAGKSLGAPGWPVPRTVVGVVHDASNAAIWREKEMALYVPRQATTDERDMRLILRTSGDLQAAGAALKSYAASLDPNLRFEAVPLESLLRIWMLPSRVAAGAAAALAFMALAMACIGVYGVVSFAVSHRLLELGVRMALGASAHDVVALVLRDGWRLIRLGLVLGGASSLLGAPLLGRLLFGVSAFDPVTLCGVPLLLAAIALGACYIPARRASRLEPLAVLRVE
jgi:predicted permease